MPMEGFTEKSVPEGWDMGLGTVVGYRTWTYRRHGEYCLPGRYLEMVKRVISPLQGLYQPLHDCNCQIGLHGRWGQFWPEPVMNATCQRSEYEYYPAFHERVRLTRCPRVLENPELCGCGIWAYWQLPPGEPDIPLNEPLSTTWPVAGRVEGSGRVVIGTKGFRCERARLTHLSVFRYTPQSVIDDLEKIYGIPVLVGGRGLGPFVNPVRRAIHGKTSPDPLYGPAVSQSPLWRKTVRVITGY